ncbi:hypothetical protein GOODEAATRI_028393 [Goodea atripinnis]|uniref:Uncharacterized protein n=1 Tax=Goodea atripinnis TaxID=208336 RepID=A0ABV0P8G8_9TELE
MLTEESMSVTEEEPDKVVEDHMTSWSPQLLTELPSQTASTSTSSLGILVSSWPYLRSKGIKVLFNVCLALLNMTWHLHHSSLSSYLTLYQRATERVSQPG